MTDAFFEMTVDIVHETEMAFLVNDGDEETWIPKSMIVESDEIAPGDKTVVISVTGWWAEKEGLA